MEKPPCHSRHHKSELEVKLEERNGKHKLDLELEWREGEEKQGLTIG